MRATRSQCWRRSRSWAHTPPCFDAVHTFAFDATDQLHYVCGDTVRRGTGELLFSGPYHVLGVLSSGRLIATKYEVDGSVTRNLPGYYLLDIDGTELLHVDLADWVGGHQRVGFRATVQADAAFVAFARTYRGGTRHEVVIVRIDGATATWRKVRRVPVESHTQFDALPLPDGRLLYLVGGDSHRLMEFPPHGPPRVVVRSGEGAAPPFDHWADLHPGPNRAAP